MSEYYFRTSELSVGYNGRPLIHDIEICVRAGEILTLIGPNGSGKSTILKSITKHLAAIRGDSFIADASVGAMSYKELSRRLAVVLTERIKGELLTCWDVVATGRYPYTNSLGLLSGKDRDKVRAAMERVHAADLAERDFTAISDGQRQRILLARAICQEPEIIVLDEPTSFLDIRHKLELLTILRTMAKEKGITVIMSLHEIDLAQKISDKIMCVHGDVIEHFGTPDEIFRPEIINDLYGITEGTYNITFGSVELPRPAGEPKTFVISGCGSGVVLFRRLQKENTPFYAGILYRNDVDWQVAQNLAAEVVAEDPFMPISDGTYQRALALMRQCETVLCAGVPIGETNRRIADLIEAARSMGLLQEE
ncbi:MAG: ABC transporter ATP-binding protein [Ruminococcaceae bacterium]|jgi:iron complex transport system ATP-binding protein|nr:ABC transporter ATP-binding protein [Oscillospiraceae bacterium]